MYRSNKIESKCNVVDSDCIERFETSAYHPFSYYVLGGSDPTGDHLNMTADVSFDSDDAVNDVDAAPLFSAEPKANAMDVAEVLGTADVEDIREKNPKEDDDKK